MGIFPHGLECAFIKQQPHGLVAGCDAQLPAGACDLGVDRLWGLAGEPGDLLAAVVGGDIGHHFALAIGQQVGGTLLVFGKRRHFKRLMPSQGRRPPLTVKLDSAAWV